jgi:hypothetical protein
MENSDAKEKKDLSPKERSQDSLQNLVKLIMTLALGVLALSGTFASQLSENIGLFILILFSSWVFLILSIFFGIRAISTITQFIMNDTQNWWNESIKTARWSWNMFQFGIVLIVIYGSSFAVKKAFFTNTPKNETQKVQLTNEEFHISLKDTIKIKSVDKSSIIKKNTKVNSIKPPHNP